MSKKKLPDYERPEMPFERERSSPGAGTWAAAGFEFGIYVTLFFLGGSYLDGKLGTGNWLAAAGALIGVALGMYMLLRRVLRSS